MPSMTRAPWRHLALLALIYLAFVSLGLPDGVLGVAWTQMRGDLNQTLQAVGLMTITITVSSGLCTQFTRRLLAWMGTGRLVMLSGLMTGLALLGFSMAPTFGQMLMLAVPLGLGAGAVDAALNHFVAAHYSSRHMNWLHGCWGIGATLGPLVMGSALSNGSGWRGGYQTIALMQLALAFALWLGQPLWPREHTTPPGEASSGPAPECLPRVAPLAAWLSPVAFLLYVAAEAGTGLWSASVLVNVRGLDAATAAGWVSLFFGSITAGRFGVGLIANRMGNRRLVRMGILAAIAGASLFALTDLPKGLSLAGLILMGLGCAPIYPSMMHETARRFPPDLTPIVIGRQVGLSYVGSAGIPAACGLLAGYVGLSFVMPALVLILLALLVVTEQLNRLT